MPSLIPVMTETDFKDGGYGQEADGIDLVCKGNSTSMYFL